MEATGREEPSELLPGFEPYEPTSQVRHAHLWNGGYIVTEKTKWSLDMSPATQEGTMLGIVNQVKKQTTGAVIVLDGNLIPVLG